MYHFFAEPQQVRDGMVTVTGPDVNHIRNVLRMKSGETVAISDGKGNTHVCVLEELQTQQIRAKILKTETSSTELKNQLVLYQGLPKSDKMELIIQKCVELGVSRIVPVETRRTIVKLDAKKEASRIQRWNTISEGAAKQSGRSLIPEVSKVLSWKEALEEAKNLDICLIPYEKAECMSKTREVLQDIKPGQSVGIFVGPEGGFEESEIQQAMENGGTPITLGRRILRTETAGMAVLAMLVLLLEE